MVKPVTRSRSRPEQKLSLTGGSVVFFNKQIRQPALIFLPHKSMNVAFQCRHPQGLESLLGIIALFAEELLQLL